MGEADTLRSQVNYLNRELDMAKAIIESKDRDIAVLKSALAMSKESVKSANENAANVSQMSNRIVDDANKKHSREKEEAQDKTRMMLTAINKLKLRLRKLVEENKELKKGANK